LRDRESIELGFGPTCWHRLSLVAGPRKPASADVPSGQVNGHEVPAVSLPQHSTAPASPRDSASGDFRDIRPATRIRADAGPLAVAIGWLVIVAALLALVEYWRWVVLGLAVLVGLALLGVLLEWFHARRHAAPTVSARARTPRR
jgi:hypothetical protein